MYRNEQRYGRSLPTLGRKQEAFTLIEVLITMLVMSVGILGIAVMQMKALQFAHASFQRSVAVVQANDLAERLWAGICDLPDGRDDIFDQWEIDHQGQLPAWVASLGYSDTGLLPTYTVTIAWTDERAVESESEGGATFTFVHHTSVPILSCAP
jgi:type IV pilus assembly protein PilV